MADRDLAEGPWVAAAEEGLRWRCRELETALRRALAFRWAPDTSMQTYTEIDRARHEIARLLGPPARPDRPVAIELLAIEARRWD